MKRSDLLHLSAVNVFTSPVRTALTVLGIAIGVGAILAVLTLGDAGKTQVESEMLRLGIDKVWLTAGDGGTLRHGDAALLEQKLGTTVTEQVYCPVEVACGNKRMQALLVGCQPNYLALMDTRVSLGRSFWPVEYERGSRTVLIGAQVARDLGMNMQETLSSRKISVLGQLFRVAGICEQRNQLSQIDAAQAVFLPLDVFCELLGDTVYEMTVSVPDKAKPQTIANRAVELLESGRAQNVQAVTMQVQLEAATSVMGIFVDVLAWVAAICILVGGIGVMNILLVSVRERRREIGVMKSMGASGKQICTLFLLEALLYALAGGVLGVGTGFLLVAFAARAIGLSAAISGSDILRVLLIALAIGLFFGVLPALRASRMTPVDALRE